MAKKAGVIAKAAAARAGMANTISKLDAEGESLAAERVAVQRDLHNATEQGDTAAMRQARERVGQLDEATACTRESKVAQEQRLQTIDHDEEDEALDVLRDEIEPRLREALQATIATGDRDGAMSVARELVDCRCAIADATGKLCTEHPMRLVPEHMRPDLLQHAPRPPVPAWKAVGALAMRGNDRRERQRRSAQGATRPR